jgi:hypothetical protein
MAIPYCVCCEYAIVRQLPQFASLWRRHTKKSKKRCRDNTYGQTNRFAIVMWSYAKYLDVKRAKEFPAAAATLILKPFFEVKQPLTSTVHLVGNKIQAQ